MVYNIENFPLIPYVRRVSIELLRKTQLTCFLTEFLVNVTRENYRNTTSN